MIAFQQFSKAGVEEEVEGFVAMPDLQIRRGEPPKLLSSLRLESL